MIDLSEDDDFTGSVTPAAVKKEEWLNIDALLKGRQPLVQIAERLFSGALDDLDLLKKDSLDKFIDYVIHKIFTGYVYIPDLKFPTKRMEDVELERKVIELINVHLYPDIVYKILKQFARNIHNSDTNLYLAYLITSDPIITAVYETFKMFRRDTMESDKNRRALNVKRLQQFPESTGNTASSPLDAACRFKYILEFIAFKQDVRHLYTAADIRLGSG